MVLYILQTNETGRFQGYRSGKVGPSRFNSKICISIDVFSLAHIYFSLQRQKLPGLLFE
jgi:hypothetical protein